MVLRNTTAAFLLSFLFATAAMGQAPFLQDSLVADEVREAALRHYMPNDDREHEEKVVCVSADKTLSDEFLRRLALKTARVVRSTECTVDAASGVRFKGSSEYGVLTSITSIRWLSGTEVEVEGGNYWSGFGATYSRLRIAYKSKSRKWVVKSEVITGVS